MYSNLAKLNFYNNLEKKDILSYFVFVYGYIYTVFVNELC